MHAFFLPLTEPLGIFWFLLLAGLGWLLVRRRWRSAVWLSLPVLLLFLLGSTPLVDILAGRAEAEAARESLLAGANTTQDHGKSTVVVVLGGGFYLSDRDNYGFALSDGSSRVLTGLQLLREKKASALVLGGGRAVPGKPGVSLPSLLQGWVMAWGLAGSAEVVTNLGVCGNTHDEAVQFRKLDQVYGWRKVLLVTSALHIPRAVALFKKQGIEVEPVACDFKVYGVPAARSYFSFFPSLDRLQILGLYLHEKIGWWVYRLRGWV